jgi:predicted Fe-S protein YdhL (DUF1289 family)
MTDEIRRRETVESPCVKICVLHPVTGLCLGCHRTAAEIAAWPTMSPEARRAVMSALSERAPLVRGTRRGGRRRTARPG